MNNRYLTVAEAAREVTNVLGQYVDKTFVQMLCERKEIQASCIPSRDGRKNDIFMIHEGQIDKICLALRGDEIFEAKKEEEKPMETREQFDTLEPGSKYLTTNEAAECLGVRRETVASMINKGYIPAKKVKRPANQGGKQPYVYMIDESDVEEKMKVMEKKHSKSVKVKEHESVGEPEPDPYRGRVFSQDFYDCLNKMKEEMHKTNEQLEKLIEQTNTMVLDTRNMIKKYDEKHPGKDISQVKLESYKEGFKDGFKAAMEVK